MLYDDTIAAIATPAGVGGIGIIRISGPEALPILQRLFVPARRGPWRPFRMRFGHVVTAEGETVDEALAVYMRAPRSFTAEDVVEISCHGGPLVVNRTLGLALEAGARPAEPGEFTMRAFLNGRIDMTQAEATLDVINARTDAGLALAQAQLSGWLAGKLRQIRETLLGPLAYFTALVDFPEDEVEPQDAVGPLEEGLRALERLLATADQGIVYRQGARAALVGVPNVGKSSLLNALLRVDRAIVTPIPGTTRDTLEETANLGGVPVVLVDTAGITETEDVVERIGIARSREALAAADLALLVLDATRPPTDAEFAIAALTEGKPTIVVLNKVDLIEQESGVRSQESRVGTQGDGEMGRWGDGQTEGSTSVHPVTPSPRHPVTPSPRHPVTPSPVAVSAWTGAGLDELVKAMQTALIGDVTPNDARLITNSRHRDALSRATQSIRDALDSYARGVPADLLAIDVTAALTAIGEVTGESLQEDLLATIFSRFCIGK
jgi:tRNA modification GTPase